MSAQIRQSRLPGVPVANTNGRIPRHHHRRPYQRSHSRASVGARWYRVAVTLQANDGIIEIAYPLGPVRQSRYQAPKLLARVREWCPLAYLWVEQSIKYVFFNAAPRLIPETLNYLLRLARHLLKGV